MTKIPPFSDVLVVTAVRFVSRCCARTLGFGAALQLQDWSHSLSVCSFAVSMAGWLPGSVNPRTLHELL